MFKNILSNLELVVAGASLKRAEKTNLRLRGELGLVEKEEVKLTTAKEIDDALENGFVEIKVTCTDIEEGTDAEETFKDSLDPMVKMSFDTAVKCYAELSLKKHVGDITEDELSMFLIVSAMLLELMTQLGIRTYTHKPGKENVKAVRNINLTIYAWDEASEEEE